MFHEHLGEKKKKGYSAVMECSILYVSIRSHWLTAWFRSSLFLLICILEILSVAKRKALKSPTIAVDLSIFPFSSISFASWIFSFCYLVCLYSSGSLFFFSAD